MNLGNCPFLIPGEGGGGGVVSCYHAFNYHILPKIGGV